MKNRLIYMTGNVALDGNAKENAKISMLLNIVVTA